MNISVNAVIYKVGEDWLVLKDKYKHTDNKLKQ